MKVLCSVSIGELVDKLTILEIKLDKIVNPLKASFVMEEKIALQETFLSLGLPKIEKLQDELKEVNLKLWEIEDKIRVKEKEQSFDKEFIQLARSVYKTNDERFRIKNLINEKFDSEMREVKSYKA